MTFSLSLSSIKVTWLCQKNMCSATLSVPFFLKLSHFMEFDNPMWTFKLCLKSEKSP